MALRATLFNDHAAARRECSHSRCNERRLFIIELCCPKVIVFGAENVDTREVTDAGAVNNVRVRMVRVYAKFPPHNHRSEL